MPKGPSKQEEGLSQQAQGTTEFTLLVNVVVKALEGQD